MIVIVQEDLNLEVWIMALEEVTTTKMTIDGSGTLVGKKFMGSSKVWTKRNMRRKSMTNRKKTDLMIQILTNQWMSLKREAKIETVVGDHQDGLESRIATGKLMFEM